MGVTIQGKEVSGLAIGGDVFYLQNTGWQELKLGDGVSGTVLGKTVGGTAYFTGFMKVDFTKVATNSILIYGTDDISAGALVNTKNFTKPSLSAKYWGTIYGGTSGFSHSFSSLYSMAVSSGDAGSQWEKNLYMRQSSGNPYDDGILYFNLTKGNSSSSAQNLDGSPMQTNL